jgi:aspartate--ammonia ligase
MATKAKKAAAAPAKAARGGGRGASCASPAPRKGDKRADLAGPGISTYEEVAKVLPKDYSPILGRKDTQIAIRIVKEAMEDGLARELNLIRVECPLIVSKESGVNDYLDRDGSRTPVDFPCGLGLDKRIDAQVVQAATKWKRMALAQFGMQPGEGLYTDMRAVRKDYFLDHDHSAYVDQWDWELAITAKDRNLAFLTRTVEKLWKVLKDAEARVQKEFPALRSKKYGDLADELTFLHAEEILERYPDLPRKQRETAILQEHPAVFIYGIGWTLKDGYPHEMRAADYTTGSPRRSPPRASRRTASTATSSCGTRSRSAATSSRRWGSA